MLPIKVNSKNSFSYKKKLIILSSIALLLGSLSYHWLTLDTFKTFRINVYDTFVEHYLKQMGFQMQNLSIDVSYRSLRKIHYKREEAVSVRQVGAFDGVGILFSKDTDYVPITLTYKNKKMKGKMRLKGDTSTHLAGEDWSYRIKLSGENRIEGMKTFSIQRLTERGYLYDWFYKQTLLAENLIHMRSKFVIILINGKRYGIYNLEEHFDHRLIENNQQKDMPIFKFDESILWQHRFHEYHNNPAKFIFLDIFPKMPVSVFKKNKWLQTSQFRKISVLGTTLINKFRTGELNTSTIYDINKYGTYVAITKLTGGSHGLWWANQRFYLNPFTLKFEPIGFDGKNGPVRPLNVFSNKNTARFYYETWYQDPLFFEAYIKELNRISQPHYLTQLIQTIENKNQIDIDIQWPHFTKKILSRSVLERNQQVIRKWLNPSDIFIQELKSNQTVSLTNTSNLPVLLLKYQSKNGKEVIVTPPQLLYPHALATKDYPSYYILPHLIHSISFRVLGLDEIKEVKLSKHIKSTQKEVTEPHYQPSYFKKLIQKIRPYI